MRGLARFQNLALKAPGSEINYITSEVKIKLSLWGDWPGARISHWRHQVQKSMILIRKLNENPWGRLAAFQNLTRPSPKYSHRTV